VIAAEVLIVGKRRGPSAWSGTKQLEFRILPRIGETVSTGDGWTYWVKYVDHDVANNCIWMQISSEGT
jgi:hypothetical protein